MIIPFMQCLPQFHAGFSECWLGSIEKYCEERILSPSRKKYKLPTLTLSAWPALRPDRKHSSRMLRQCYFVSMAKCTSFHAATFPGSSRERSVTTLIRQTYSDEARVQKSKSAKVHKISDSMILVFPNSTFGLFCMEIEWSSYLILEYC